VFQTSFALHRSFAFAPFWVGVNKSKERRQTRWNRKLHSLIFGSYAPNGALHFFVCRETGRCPVSTSYAPNGALVISIVLPLNSPTIGGLLNGNVLTTLTISRSVLCDNSFPDNFHFFATFRTGNILDDYSF
jgi:hypothetical protein